METVDWEWENTEDRGGDNGFSENQVGSVTMAIEPVQSGSPRDWVSRQFEEDSSLEILPIEHDGGVVGVVTRDQILNHAPAFLEVLSGKSLEKELAPHGTLDARESVDKVMSELFGDQLKPLVEWFLVYLDGQYYGVTTLRRLVSRSAERREQDLLKAQEVQENAVAKRWLPATRWNYGHWLSMAYGIGGDTYQEWAQLDGTCFLACFDVSGKGLSGSLVTSALGGFFSALRSDPNRSLGLTTLADRLNSFLQEILPLGTFVTGVLFQLPANPGPGAKLRLSNLGYGPVYFYTRQENKVSGKAIRPNLPPLGLGAWTDPTLEIELPWEAGTKLYVFSDGMTDLVNSSGKRYGEEQLRTFVSQNYKEGAEDFVAQVRKEVGQWKGDAPQADDITVLTIQA